jgi:hypothetical protein
MGYITVPNTLANSTTADAGHVNDNFSSIISGTSDGTKDFSINALTCAGAATLNGNVTLGNASSDTLTVTASLASTIAIGTTYSYDIGSSSIGLRSLYLGSADSAARGTRLIGATVASGYTFTLPTSGGTSRYRLETDGSGTTSWQPVRRSSTAADNVGISCSVAASALTIALKGADGNDASSTNPIDIVFRNATAATGTALTRSVTAALSMTVSSGSTLGHASSTTHYMYVYALDNSGTVELAVSSVAYDEGTIVSTTAEGGAGAADSNRLIYSTTARANVPIRMIARLKSSQATAGTWASVPTEISFPPFDIPAVSLNYGQSSGTTIANDSTTTIKYDSKSYDTHNAYNTSTGVFTVPKAGKYLICAAYHLNTTTAFNGVSEHMQLQILVNSSAVRRSQKRPYSNEEYPGVQISTILDLSAADTVEIASYHDAGASLDTYTTANYTQMSIAEIRG